jgi:hypothetical protein
MRQKRPVIGKQAWPIRSHGSCVLLPTAPSRLRAASERMTARQ